MKKTLHAIIKYVPMGIAVYELATADTYLQWGCWLVQVVLWVYVSWPDKRS